MFLQLALFGAQVILGVLGVYTTRVAWQAVSDPRPDTTLGRSGLFFPRLGFVCGICSIIVGLAVGAIGEYGRSPVEVTIKWLSYVFTLLWILLMARNYLHMRSNMNTPNAAPNSAPEDRE